jgi:hypothetical protein
VGRVGRQALSRAADEVQDLVRTSYAPHEVIAMELRFAGPTRGFRRTVLATAPTPMALMLLCLRMCDPGEDVVVLQHTATQGPTTRAARWPFGVADAEELTRPPAREPATDDFPVVG